MNERADEPLWRSLGETLRGFFRRRVPDPALADDLAQETLLRIYRGLGSLKEESRLRPWVFQIARNVLSDHFRKAPDDLPLDDGALETLTDERDTGGNLDSTVGDWLFWMIGSLPPDYRDAVKLAEVDGLKAQEVADRLGISLPAAKSRILRGREKLQKVLGDCCEVHFDRQGHVMDYTRRNGGGCGTC